MAIGTPLDATGRLSGFGLHTDSRTPQQDLVDDVLSRAVAGGSACLLAEKKTLGSKRRGPCEALARLEVRAWCDGRAHRQSFEEREGCILCSASRLRPGSRLASGDRDEAHRSK